MDTETSSDADSIAGEEDNEENIYPSSPLSQASRLSYSSTFSRYDRHFIRSIKFMLSWILWPAVFLLRLPHIVFQLACFRRGGTVPTGNLRVRHISSPHQTRRSVHTKDHVVQRTTDRRRGVIEVLFRIMLPEILSLGGTNNSDIETYVDTLISRVNFTRIT